MYRHIVFCPMYSRALRLLNRQNKVFKAGSGFTDDERHNPPAVGSVITYRFNGLTDAGLPRHPVFVRLRPDVSAADIRAEAARA